MKRLAIIGASSLQNPLILKARIMGVETHVFAWEAGDVGEDTADFFYPISIIEKEEILDVCRKVGVNGVTSIASDLAAVTVGYVADAMGLAGNSLAATRMATNKGAMREAFRAHKDPSPDFMVLTSMPEDLDAVLREMTAQVIDFPVIVKPTDRSGSRGVTHVSDPAELMPAIQAAMEQSFAGEVIIETVIPGQEYSVECFTVDGHHSLLAITQKFTTGAPHYIETGHIEPSGLSEEMRKKVEAVVLHALDSLEITNGASHSEVRITPDGSIGIVEIGARMGGDFIGSHLVPMTSGVDFVSAVVSLALGDDIHVRPARTGRAAAVRYILTRADYDTYRRIKSSHPSWIVAEDVGEVSDHAVTSSADRSGFYILRADDRESLLALGIF